MAYHQSASGGSGHGCMGLRAVRFSREQFSEGFRAGISLKSHAVGRDREPLFAVVVELKAQLPSLQ